VNPREHAAYFVGGFRGAAVATGKTLDVLGEARKYMTSAQAAGWCDPAYAEQFLEAVEFWHSPHNAALQALQRIVAN
jgi:hypothetical protein